MDDLTPAQKVKIVRAYVEFLRAKAALGSTPTRGEIRLLRAGIEDVNDDIRDAVRAFLPVAKAYIQTQEAVMREFFPKMVDK